MGLIITIAAIYGIGAIVHAIIRIRATQEENP